MSDSQKPPVAFPPEPDAGGELERDVHLDKPGIVGARWWHKSLMAEDAALSRRSALKGLAVMGGVIGGIGFAGYGISRLALLGSERSETTSLATRSSLAMQKLYGWDFGARGTPLVFDGKTEAPFVRAELEKLGAVMQPRLNAKFYVGTLVESLLASPKVELPAPPDGSPKADAGPFSRLADVIVPIATPAMERAYRVGEALARLCADRQHLAVLADLPGPEAVAFAAGACGLFEPVLLFDNWPHPHGVVPSHLTLAALAYYQPRFAEQAAARRFAEPLFVLDRARLSAYHEESDRFDNRYYARVPKLQTLARDGIKGLLYVVGSAADLPEPDDLNGLLSETGAPAVVDVRALSLADFDSDPPSSAPGPLFYGGSPATDGSFASSYPESDGGSAPPGTRRTATAAHLFQARTGASSTPPSNLGKVAVVVTASGLLVAAALDRKGSMNRFSGGWGG